jgi:hypothetical protein
VGAGVHKIRFEPVRDWQELRHLRRAVTAALEGIPDSIRMALVISANELVENGLLHGDAVGEIDRSAVRDSQTCSPVVLELMRSDDAVELSVTTRLRSVERASVVMRLVEEVESAIDQHTAYVDRLLELARADANTTSKLGFHRIALEGGCSLQAIHRDDLLTVCARRSLV